jgi:hypothetical protein
LNGLKLVRSLGIWIVQTEPPPLEMILQEIEKALEVKLYYLALTLSLTIPDICSALESPDGVATADRYKDWYRLYVSPEYGNLTDVDCYSLRNGVVHQGRLGHPRSQYAYVAFTFQNLPNIAVFHGNIAMDVLQLDVRIFCRDICGAARRWFEVAKDEPNLKKNLERLVRLRPNGIEGHFDVPCIA